MGCLTHLFDMQYKKIKVRLCLNIAYGNVSISLYLILVFEVYAETLACEIRFINFTNIFLPMYGKVFPCMSKYKFALDEKSFFFLISRTRITFIYVKTN